MFSPASPARDLPSRRLVRRVDDVQFTRVERSPGKRIGQRTAERLIPFILELGGKDAMIVTCGAPTNNQKDI